MVLETRKHTTEFGICCVGNMLFTVPPNYTLLHSETVTFLAQCQVPSTSHEGPSANPISIILPIRLVCLATCWILDVVCAN